VVGAWDRNGVLAEQTGIVQFADVDGARLKVFDEIEFLTHFGLFFR